jgi:periplasmic protein TonB
MGYQALLFCPDEKTARTVTQVLTDLEFAVVPCTEPFAAVKKLMGEHFDAVVVDCDNEQNATLLFKSARNAPNNQTSLAVAVVEGQIGVAKAFRIGANLVLTKPINVEQAKGTLRVARGLLRKGETAKPAAASGPKPASAPPLPTKPTPAAATSWPSSPAPSEAASGIPVQNPTPRTKAAAVMSAAAASGEDLIEAERAEAASLAADKAAAQSSAPKMSSAIPSVAEVGTSADKTKADKTDRTAKQPTGKTDVPTLPPSAVLPTKTSVAAASGAASAPAPAREVKSSAVVDDKPAAVATGSSNQIEEVTSSDSSANAPTLTFGGTLGADAKPVAGGDSKKTLLAVVIVLLIVAAAYVAWSQFGGKIPWLNGPAPQPATAPAVAPRPATAVTARPLSTPSAAPSPDSVVPPTPTKAESSISVENPSGTKPASTSASPEETGPRPGKTAPAASDVPKPSAPTSITGKAPATKAAASPVIKKSATSPSVTPIDAPAPSLDGIGSNDSGTLPNLISAGSAPTPVLQTMNVSQGLSQGLILKKTQPSYPAMALQMRIEGPVELLATISKTGGITAVKILHGDPQLARAALEAVKQWKYKPYLLDGQPVEIQTQITVNFKLPR